MCTLTFEKHLRSWFKLIVEIHFCSLELEKKTKVQRIKLFFPPQHLLGKMLNLTNIWSVNKQIEKPRGNMWKITGCGGRVGAVFEYVLVAWSVGPVLTKHLISLIKRTLAWYVLHSGESGHAPSLHSPPLSHTHSRTAINHNNTKHREGKEGERESKFWAKYQETVCCDPVKTRQETAFEAQQKHTVKDVFVVTDHRLVCLSSYSLKRKGQSPCKRLSCI